MRSVACGAYAERAVRAVSPFASAVTIIRPPAVGQCCVKGSFARGQDAWHAMLSCDVDFAAGPSNLVDAEPRGRWPEPKGVLLAGEPPMGRLTRPASDTLHLPGESLAGPPLAPIHVRRARPGMLSNSRWRWLRGRGHNSRRLAGCESRAWMCGLGGVRLTVSCILGVVARLHSANLGAVKSHRIRTTRHKCASVLWKVGRRMAPLPAG